LSTQYYLRAEVASYADHSAATGKKGDKKKGLMRHEGKEFVVRDGDGKHLRFNA
jgi:ribosome-binding ATPase YchF (GTP1/OBG family)